MSATAALTKLGLQLPEVAAPVANYVPAASVPPNLIMTSGQIPTVAGQLSSSGKLGADLQTADGQAAAQVAALNALAAVAAVAGGLERITQVVRVVVYVASTPDFTDQPQVADGASDLFVKVFGDAGRHIRSAVGVSSLPRNAPVEVELTVAVGAGEPAN